MPRQTGEAVRRSTTASAERLLNLLIALLDRESGYTREQLRAIVPGYDRAGNQDAFERMFERDKAHLRSLGYPVEEIPDDDPWASDAQLTPRYRVPRGSYRLPEVRFSAEESAVLAVAADAWNDAAQDRLARRALDKLEPALSSEVTPGRDVQPTVAVADPAFEPLLSAVLAHRTVRFDYVDRTGAYSRRTVQPWGVGSRYGAWYLAGWDTDRGAQRTFRLSRIISEVAVTRETFEPPADFSMGGQLARMVRQPPRLRVVVFVREGSGQLLRRIADPAASGTWRAPEGFDAVELAVHDTESAAEHVCAAGPDAWVPCEPSAGDPAASPAVDPRVQAAVAEAVTRRLADARAFQARMPGVAVQWGKQRRQGAAKASTEHHLARLLHIVRHVYAHQGAELEETARHFGITDAELVNDLQTLFVCGRPGHLPDQLIDASWDDGHIYLGNAQELSEPVRLTVPEASALLMGLQTLQAVPGGDSRVVRSAMRKVATAADALPLADALAAPEGDAAAEPRDSALVGELRRAIAQNRRVRLRYLVTSRDEVTERLVDPVRMILSDGHQYLRGWCLQANAPRTFRADRIVGCEDAGAAEVHPRMETEVRSSIQPAKRRPVQAVVVTDRRGRWIVEHYHAKRFVEVSVPPAEGGGGDATRAQGPAGNSQPGETVRARAAGGPRPLPEFVAAEVDFPTLDALSSLVTRHAGHVGVVSPPEAVAAVEQWLNSSGPGVCPGPRA
ncbi:WYL domain-containing protein [Kocuria tytonicola]|uniref:WYL domain-containing protein n=1 Tax=Kocuria tytonicola TaxID=2055946 RepID=A0A3L9L8J1_9MICC|nr:WYL domain-containing protein [Kocuria tytonicola]RLY95035.1 WYL domain-containing protein [Kocuria tytonicola]RLZ03216.1 WYL domain-containing protein [Kocuria tytonicola]